MQHCIKRIYITIACQLLPCVKTLVAVLFIVSVIFSIAGVVRPSSAMAASSKATAEHQIAMSTQSSDALGHLDIPDLDSEEEQSWFDMTEHYFSSVVHDFSTFLDHSFAKQDDEEDLMNRSYLRLRHNSEYSHHGYYSSEDKISVRVDLPHVENNWNLIFETDPDDYDSLESKQRDLTQKTSGNTDGAIGGIRLQDEQVSHWKTNFDIGLKIRLPADPFVRAEFHRVEGFWENWTAQFKQEFFYYDSIGLGSLTEMNFYFAANEEASRIFLMDTSGQYLYEEESWELVHQFKFYNRVNENHMMEYSTGISVDPDASDEMTNSWVSVSWRQKLYKNWLYLSITPILDVPREYDYKLNPGIHIGLEAFFSKNRRVDRLNRNIPKSTRKIK